MEASISKAQLEVWEWKEKIYKEFKDMPLDEVTRISRERTQPIIDEINRCKREKQEKISSAACCHSVI